MALSPFQFLKIRRQKVHLSVKETKWQATKFLKDVFSTMDDYDSNMMYSTIST